MVMAADRGLVVLRHQVLSGSGPFVASPEPDQRTGVQRQAAPEEGVTILTGSMVTPYGMGLVRWLS